MAKLAPETANFMHSITDHFANGSWLYMGFKRVRKETMKPVAVRSNYFFNGLENDVFYNSNKYTHSYVCPQAFSAGGRCEEHLYALQNIVVDVDCHSLRYCKGLRVHKLNMLAHLLVHDAFSDYDLPMPNYIVFTGRGLQIWWRHEPMAANACKNTWKSIVKVFIEIIKKILEEHSNPEMDVMDSLAGLEVDEQASLNPVGLFRIPGTYNPNAKAYSYLQECLGAETIYSYKELRQFRDDYRAENPIKRKKPTVKIRYQVPGYEWNPTSWAEILAGKIENLRDLRDADIGIETRNNFCFALYCLYRAAGMDDDDAMDRLRDFNEGFKQPMTERELKSTLCSARRKEYKYSEGKLVALLDISKKEAEKIGLKYPIEDKNGSKNEPKNTREAIEKRHKMIIHLYKTTNMTQEEVAKEVGVSRKNVGEVLRKEGISRANRKADKIKNLSEKGNSVEQIAKKTGCSNRTVYRALENTVGKTAEGAPKAAQNELTNLEAVATENSVSVAAAKVKESSETEMVQETSDTMTPSLFAGKERMSVAEDADGALSCLAAVAEGMELDFSCESESESASAKKSPLPYNNGYHPHVGAHVHTHRRAGGASSETNAGASAVTVPVLCPETDGDLSNVSPSGVTAIEGLAAGTVPSPACSSPGNPSDCVGSSETRLVGSRASDHSVTGGSDPVASCSSERSVVCSGSAVSAPTRLPEAASPLLPTELDARLQGRSIPPECWGLHNRRIDSQGRMVFTLSPLPVSRDVNYHWIWHPVDSKPLPEGFVEPIPLQRKP